MAQKEHGGIYRKGRRFKKPRFHRTIRHLGISVPATGFSILGTVISVSETVGRGIAGGGEKRSTQTGKDEAEGFEGFEIKPFSHCCSDFQ